MSYEQIYINIFLSLKDSNNNNNNHNIFLHHPKVLFETKIIKIFNQVMYNTIFSDLCFYIVNAFYISSSQYS